MQLCAVQNKGYILGSPCGKRHAVHVHVFDSDLGDPIRCFAWPKCNMKLTHIPRPTVKTDAIRIYEGHYVVVKEV